jgi:hypothetical protein
MSPRPALTRIYSGTYNTLLAENLASHTFQEPALIYGVERTTQTMFYSTRFKCPTLVRTAQLYDLGAHIRYLQIHFSPNVINANLENRPTI